MILRKIIVSPEAVGRGQGWRHGGGAVHRDRRDLRFEAVAGPGAHRARQRLLGGVVGKPVGFEPPLVKLRIFTRIYSIAIPLWGGVG